MSPLSDQAEMAKLVFVTAEMIGHDISKNAAVAMAAELSSYPRADITAALRKCSRECRGRLTLADILARIDDGHPGPEQAWAMCCVSESDTVVWTNEMADSYGLARTLVAEGDTVGARMAFKETYIAALQRARAGKQKARWWVSPGHDAAGRERAIRAAVDLGLLPPTEIAKHRQLPRDVGAPNKLASGDVVPLAELIPTLRLVRPESALPKNERGKR